MPTHVLYGDSYLVPNRLVNLIAASGASDVLDANRHHLLASEVNPGELLSMSYALPFMDDYRLIVVEGLLAATESQSRGRRRNPPVESGIAAQWKLFVDAIPKTSVGKIDKKFLRQQYSA